jgi:hypothetical protein
LPYGNFNATLFLVTISSPDKHGYNGTELIVNYQILVWLLWKFSLVMIIEICISIYRYARCTRSVSIGMFKYALYQYFGEFSYWPNITHDSSFPCLNKNIFWLSQQFSLMKDSSSRAWLICFHKHCSQDTWGLIFTCPKHWSMWLKKNLYIGNL